ncbi:MAG TPA: phosphotransferase [Methanocella sp.]|uniref:phosphotransferase n=1 Tax=Methanocella sp. TaxID=2052833 RepID=UPI002C682D1C|nr:phosphotransferase [Methanocella sp.]HTY90502.1 phosphotransferase [Methanocella sp.]
MQSTAAPDWLAGLARQHPDVFGASSGPLAEMEVPPASSHESRVYGADVPRVHVKFFRRTLGRTGVTYDPCREMLSEYGILREFEKNGFASGRHRVVRALGVNEGLDCALATAYVPGESLLSIVQRTLNGGEDRELLSALDLTAGLLRKIHTLMPQSPKVDGADTFYSFMKPLFYLEDQGALDGSHRRIMKGLSRWHGRRPLFEQRGVTVHGDANPSNFKIHEGIIYGFDLERSRPGRSPLLDVGTMVAELQHQCGYITKDMRRAGPYVEHFLHAYAPSALESDMIEGLLPFYVALGFFKIAMLGYWKRDYRRYLVEAGARLIEEGP